MRSKKLGGLSGSANGKASVRWALGGATAALIAILAVVAVPGVAAEAVYDTSQASGVELALSVDAPESVEEGGFWAVLRATTSATNASVAISSPSTWIWEGCALDPTSVSSTSGNPQAATVRFKATLTERSCSFVASATATAPNWTLTGEVVHDVFTRESVQKLEILNPSFNVESNVVGQLSIPELGEPQQEAAPEAKDIYYGGRSPLELGVLAFAGVAAVSAATGFDASPNRRLALGATAVFIGGITMLAGGYAFIAMGLVITGFGVKAVLDSNKSDGGSDEEGFDLGGEEEI